MDELTGTAALEPGGNPVVVGRSILQTPGLSGTARSIDPVGGGLRAAESSTPALEAALANEGLEPQETIEIAGAYETPVGGVRTRSTSLGEDAMVLEVPGPGTDLGQVVLAQDESGVLTWNFPRDESGALATTRGSATNTYVIRRHVPAAPGGAETRGLLGAVGKKLLKVLVFPLVEPLIERGAAAFAGAWEADKRPYACRSFTPANYRDPAGAPLGDERWRELSGGRTLLLLHGTFSRAHAGFGGMSAELLGGLHDHYDGRVVAFDHYTLSHDPRQNAERLAAMIPGDVELELDVICHSRGGLVARVLAERPARESLRVRRIVFVATPNAGTVLADPDHIGGLVDRYTTLLNFFPDNGVTEVLEAIITVVKQLAVGSLAGLDGLAAMRPGGEFQRWLNDGGGPGAEYFALASNYEPTQPGLLAFARDAAMDRIFGDAGNDLVVPTEGVHAANGSGCFPIERLESFDTTAGIHHSAYFADARASELIRSWLQVGA